MRAIADRPQHQQVDRRSHSSFNVVFDDSWERLHSLGTSSCNPDVASGTLCEVIWRVCDCLQPQWQCRTAQGCSYESAM